VLLLDRSWRTEMLDCYDISAAAESVGSAETPSYRYLWSLTCRRRDTCPCCSYMCYRDWGQSGPLVYSRYDVSNPDRPDECWSSRTIPTRNHNGILPTLCLFFFVCFKNQFFSLIQISLNVIELFIYPYQHWAIRNKTPNESPKN